MIAAITGGEQASKRPAEGKQTGNQEEKKKRGNGLSSPIYEQCTKSSVFWAANDMHRPGGGGRCSSNTTCHISQPRQLHNRERCTLIMKSFACLLLSNESTDLYGAYRTYAPDPAFLIFFLEEVLDEEKQGERKTVKKKKNECEEGKRQSGEDGK